jgi:hypothetical protein
MKRTLALAALLLFSPAAIAQENPLEIWNRIYQVFSHPRCANCHTADEHPRWGDLKAGTAIIHPMNVLRGTGGVGNTGMRCTTCHGETNATKENSPPGAENWHLAPAEMVWFGKTSAEICAQIKDPLRNGNRSLADVAEHVKNDKLVGWGWNPGPGREPVPGSIEKTYADLLAWTIAGAPCPAN